MSLGKPEWRQGEFECGYEGLVFFFPPGDGLVRLASLKTEPSEEQNCRDCRGSLGILSPLHSCFPAQPDPRSLQIP